MPGLGDRGEALAAEFLKSRGYQIVERNWRAPGAEIDIVARKGGCLVFVEVKTRSGHAFGAPAEAVEHRKQKKLIHAANAYLALSGEPSPEARFDVVAIMMENGKHRIEHIENAFESF